MGPPGQRRNEPVIGVKGRRCDFRHALGKMKHLMMTLIRLYQVLAWYPGGSPCRHSPSCSNFALGAYYRHGFLRGTGLAVARLVRCHPFNPGGYDPVP